MKFCNVCKLTKDVSEFHKKSSSKDGLMPCCKECNNKKSREWRENNLERSRESARRYQRENREERIEYLKQYYQNNKEKLIKANTEYNKNNPEQRKETSRRYRLSKISDRDTIVRNIVRTARTNAKKRGMDFEITHEIVNQIITQNDGRCCISGIKFEYMPRIEFLHRPYAPSIDRIDNTKGYTLDNIQIVCVMVNRAKNEFTQEMFDEMCRARVRILGE